MKNKLQNKISLGEKNTTFRPYLNLLKLQISFKIKDLRTKNNT